MVYELSVKLQGSFESFCFSWSVSDSNETYFRYGTILLILLIMIRIIHVEEVVTWQAAYLALPQSRILFV